MCDEEGNVVNNNVMVDLVPYITESKQIMVPFPKGYDQAYHEGMFYEKVSYYNSYVVIEYDADTRLNKKRLNLLRTQAKNEAMKLHDTEKNDADVQLNLLKKHRDQDRVAHQIKRTSEAQQRAVIDVVARQSQISKGSMKQPVPSQMMHQLLGDTQTLMIGTQQHTQNYHQQVEMYYQQKLQQEKQQQLLYANFLRMQQQQSSQQFPSTINHQFMQQVPQQLQMQQVPQQIQGQQPLALEAPPMELEGRDYENHYAKHLYELIRTRKFSQMLVGLTSPGTSRSVIGFMCEYVSSVDPTIVNQAVNLIYTQGYGQFNYPPHLLYIGVVEDPNYVGYFRNERHCYFISQLFEAIEKNDISRLMHILDSMNSFLNA
jgi:hypothetical protein